MALGGVRHGSGRSPSWLCEKSVMVLGGIRHLWRLAIRSRICKLLNEGIQMWNFTQRKKKIKLTHDTRHVAHDIQRMTGEPPLNMSAV